MEQPVREQKKPLWIEYFKILNLCKALEEIAHQVSEETPASSDLSDKTEQLHYLAIVIRDILADNEEVLLHAIDTLERVEREEDFSHFMTLWICLEEKEKKNSMKHAIIHTQKREEECPASKPGNHLYDLRRSLAMKYGVEINAGQKGVCRVQ